MAAPLATSASDCCSACPDIPITQVPGPDGDDGTDGSDGAAGANAFSTTSAGYTQPAVGATVVVTVVSSAWAIIGADAYVQNGGYYLVTAIADATHVTLQNRGYTGNAAPTTVIGSGQRISLSGIKGTDGVAVGVTLNSISPTTTRGDLLVDNGANSPAASVVRYPAGTNGQIDVADSTQPAGRRAATVHPNASASTDNQIARYDTPVGTEAPAPVQTSSIKLTDNGALQHTGGNAKGTDAVDIQPARSAATQVASGANSFVAGKNNTGSGVGSSVVGQSNVASGISAFSAGENNTASGDASIAIGGTNVASGDLSTAIGDQHTASGAFSACLGGTLGIADGDQAATVGGFSNLAHGDYSIAFGRQSVTDAAAESSFASGYRSVANLYAQRAHAAGPFAAPGDSQESYLLWRGTTTNATITELFLDGSAIRATVPANTTQAFDILVSARASTGISASWRVVGAITNTGGVVTLVSAVTVTVTSDGTGATWGVAGGVTIDADDPTNSLRVRVTGALATTIRWTVSARLIETSH